MNTSKPTGFARRKRITDEASRKLTARSYHGAAAMKTPKKKKGIPKGAVYDGEEQWELGKRDKKGKKTGEWKYWWPTTGHLCGVSKFDGCKEYRTRYHPDGTISQQGWIRDDEIMPNEWYVMQRSKNKQPSASSRRSPG